MNLKKFISLLSIALLIFSCAQIVPLTGGEKDIEAPKELESTPANGSTGFSSKSITIEFDEYIKLTNVSSQLIVSPLMETAPEILVKGKKLVLKIESDLSPNTTYSLNFGNAISDITENNIYPNYKYVFSTGDYIDSLSYSGTVINTFDQSPKENVYVLLFDQFEDSVPLKELPRYVSLTNKKGEFSITNIANGKYKLFAINDINSNYLFDLPNEEIGFIQEPMVLEKSDSNNFVYLFEEEKNLQYIVESKHKTYGRIDLVFNLPTEDLEITILNNNEKENWGLIEKNNSGDSVQIWLYPEVFNKRIELLIKDKNEIIDTLDFDLINRSELKDSILSVSTNITTTFDLNKNVIINSQQPISNYLSDSIKLFEDSVLVTTTTFTDIGLKNFELAHDFKENTSYQLYIPPNTFENIYGLKNDTIRMNFKSKEESDYGIINLNLSPNFSENYIVQLSKNKVIIDESFLIGQQKKQYKYLSAGKYSLKLIIDKNNDQQWNTGNYLEGIQPEKVIIYSKEIKVRANWDNDISWIIKE